MVRIAFFKKNKKAFLFVMIVVVVVLFVSYFFRQPIYHENFQTKHAIVILTRGYPDIQGYHNLIKRNQAIYDVFYSRLDDPDNYDVVIFHEGNITADQQKYIQSRTQGLPLLFKEVPFQQNDQKNMDLCPPTDLSESSSSGYKNMCSFWSVGVFDFMGSYEYIIRIDEDCFLDSLDPHTIDRYQADRIMFSSGLFQENDVADVIVGMDTLFDAYLNTQNDSIRNYEIRCPYTNVMIMNVPFFMNNQDVRSILNEIKQSNCIFSNRWGDLPIWGHILTLMIDKSYYLEDKSIRYYHESHYSGVNM